MGERYGRRKGREDRRGDGGGIKWTAKEVE